MAPKDKKKKDKKKDKKSQDPEDIDMSQGMPNQYDPSQDPHQHQGNMYSPNMGRGYGDEGNQYRQGDPSMGSGYGGMDQGPYRNEDPRQGNYAGQTGEQYMGQGYDAQERDQYRNEDPGTGGKKEETTGKKKGKDSGKDKKKKDTKEKSPKGKGGKEEEVKVTPKMKEALDRIDYLEQEKVVRDKKMAKLLGDREQLRIRVSELDPYSSNPKTDQAHLVERLTDDYEGLCNNEWFLAKRGLQGELQVEDSILVFKFLCDLMQECHDNTKWLHQQVGNQVIATLLHPTNLLTGDAIPSLDMDDIKQQFGATFEPVVKETRDAVTQFLQEHSAGFNSAILTKSILQKTINKFSQEIPSIFDNKSLQKRLSFSKPLEVFIQKASIICWRMNTLKTPIELRSQVFRDEIFNNSEHIVHSQCQTKVMQARRYNVDLYILPGLYHGESCSKRGHVFVSERPPDPRESYISYGQPLTYSDDRMNPQDQQRDARNELQDNQYDPSRSDPQYDRLRSGPYPQDGSYDPSRSGPYDPRISPQAQNGPSGEYGATSYSQDPNSPPRNGSYIQELPPNGPRQGPEESQYSPTRPNQDQASYDRYEGSDPRQGPRDQDISKGNYTNGGYVQGQGELDTGNHGNRLSNEQMPLGQYGQQTYENQGYMSSPQDGRNLSTFTGPRNDPDSSPPGYIDPLQSMGSMRTNRNPQDQQQSPGGRQFDSQDPYRQSFRQDYDPRPNYEMEGPHGGPPGYTSRVKDSPML